MSSGRFEYTLKEKATLLGQFASVMRIANEQQRPARDLSRVLQAAIGDDEVIVVPKVTTTPTGKIFCVTGNFGSAAEVIEAGGYDRRWGMAEKPADIPLIVQPVDAHVRAIPLGKAVKTSELFALYPRLVDPMTALTFGVKFPDEQREAPHFTVWRDAGGGFWFVILGVSGRGRSVRADVVLPDGEWGAHYRVLVREFPSACG